MGALAPVLKCVDYRNRLLINVIPADSVADKSSFAPLYNPWLCNQCEYDGSREKHLCAVMHHLTSGILFIICFKQFLAFNVQPFVHFLWKLC